MLENVQLPSSLKSIGMHAFFACDALTNVTIPDGVTSLGSGIFANCTSLTSVTLPKTLTNVETTIFLNAPVASVYFTGDIANWCSKDLGNAIFANRSLTNNFDFYIDGNLVAGDLVIPDGVTRINDKAFFCRTGLTSIAIPDSVTSIGDCAFQGCTGLTSVTIPDSVTSIGSLAFKDCPLETVVMGNGLTTIPSTLINKATLKHFTIGTGVTSIEDNTFKSMQAIESIRIPKSVTSIGNSAFMLSASGVGIDRDIYYEGTEEEWNAIPKGTGNGMLTHPRTTMHYSAT